MVPLSPTKICAYLVSQKMLRVSQVAECQLLKEKQGPGNQKTLLDILLENNYLKQEHLKLAEQQLQKTGFEYSSLIPQEEESFDSHVPEKWVHFFQGYELLKRLGKGGMGLVYLGRQLSMDRLVALKVLSKALAEDKEYVSRFLIEARASAKFNHPNVVRGIDVQEQSGYHFLVMEYVEGQTASQIIKKQEISEELALEIAYSIALALQYANSIQMIHRDIKPDNIMVNQEGEIKLLDLGLAKEISKEKEEKLLGTPHFASPEQIRGEPLDIRTDIYSLGATLFQLLTRNYPFDGQSVPILLVRVLTEKTPDPKMFRPHLSEGFAQLLQKMMEKRKEKRIQTPDQLLEEIQKLRKPYLPAFEDSTRPNQKMQTRVLRQNFVLNELRRPKELSRTARLAKKQQTNPVFILGSVFLFIFCSVLLFFIFKSDTNTNNTSEKTENTQNPLEDPQKIDVDPAKKGPQKFDPKIEALVAQQKVLETLQLALETELAQENPPLGSLLEVWEKTQHFQKESPTSSLLPKIIEVEKQIMAKIESRGEKEFQKLEKEEASLAEKHQWQEARQIWNRFPLQLKISSWAEKTKEMQDSFNARYSPIQKDVLKIRALLNQKKIEPAKQLLQQVKVYAGAEQGQELVDLSVEITKMEKILQKELARKALKFPPDSIENYPNEFFWDVEPLLQSQEKRLAHYEKALAFLEEALERYPFHHKKIEPDIFVVKTLLQAWKEIFLFFEEALQKKEPVKIGIEPVHILKVSLSEGTITLKDKKTETVNLAKLDPENFIVYVASALKSSEDRPLKLGLFAYFLGDYAFAYGQLLKVRGENEENILSYVDYARRNKELLPTAEATRLFEVCQKAIQKKNYLEAYLPLHLLQTRYITTLFAQEKNKIIEKMADQVQKEIFSYEPNLSKKLQEILAGKVISFKNAYQIRYDFQEKEQEKDFAFLNSSANPEEWKWTREGLQGESFDTFYWKPHLSENFEIDFVLQANNLENIGFALMANGFHRQYLIYPYLKEDWAPWATGKAALISTRVKRQNSTQLDLQPLDLSSYRLSAKGTSLYAKIQSRAGKIKFWFNTQEISPDMKPLLEAKCQELERGQIGFLAGSEMCIQKMTFTGFFDPRWLNSLFE